ncbi:MAG: sporulation protein YqfD [Clostridia bacterium]|nr:sporulation protein YqfD [Clostridia bacterium]
MKVYSVISCEARNSQRLLNKFLEKNIPLKKIKIDGEILRFCVEDKYLSKSVEIVAKSGVDYTVESRGGKHLLAQMALRYVSLAVTAIAVIVCLVLAKGVCFGVDIVCDDTDITSKISEILDVNSIRPYVLKKNIDTKSLSEQLSKDIEEVGFANCYFDGGKLKIEVKKVHIIDEEEEYSKLTADRDCIITRVLVYSGTAVVKAGDVVKKGDVLIEGYIDTNPESEDNERLIVPADGVVYGETAYVKNITISDKAVMNVRTGESWKTTDVYVFGKLIGKQKMPDYEQYQMVQEEKIFGSVIPIKAVTRTYYKTQSVEIELDEAQIEEQISLACIEMWQEIPNQSKLLNNYTYKKKVDNLHIIDIYYIIEEIVSIGE